MKSFLLMILLWLLPAAAFAGDKQPANPADYTITVHVEASYARSSSSNGLYFPYQRLKAVINGKNVELTGGTGATLSGVLALGDYKAKVVPTPHAPKVARGYVVYLTYEFLFPDGKTEQYAITGFDSANSGSPQI
jgi:hypothetical protein